MSNWPLLTGAPPQFIGADSPDGVSAVLTTSAAYTPSAWVEIVSAVPAAVVGFQLTVRAHGWRRCLVEIGLGAASSEVVIARLPFLSNGAMNSGTGPDHHYQPVFVPLALPAGARLSARLTAPDGSIVARLSLRVQQASALHPVGFTRCALHGLDESNLFLSTVVANDASYGSWVQLTSATAFPVKAFFQLGNTGYPSGYAPYGSRTEHQLGIGGSGSETPVYARPIGSMYNDWPVSLYSPLTPANWPAGVRVATRCRVQSGQAWENTAGVLLFG